MKRIVLVSLMLSVLLFIGCSKKTSSDNDNKSSSETTHTESTSSENNKKTELEIARETVIEKFKNYPDLDSTLKHIEDCYKKYWTDPTIANIYYYCTSKQQNRLYYKLSNNKYLESAKEYALKIDPDYNGEFSKEMHTYVEKLFNYKYIKEEQKKAAEKEKNYNQLTDYQKKDICKYIQKQYDYYDKKYGRNTGDKYSDKIMQETADKYGLTVEQVNIIWMNMYSY